MTNRKWPRPDEDVQRLASLWRDRWTPADGIEPWLRRHLDEMTRLVRDERWRWEDIARALDLAGISYAATGRGRPWTASLLMDKAAKLRGQRRKALAGRVASGQEEVTVTVELLRETLSKIGVVHHLTVNLPGVAPVAAPVTPTTAPAPVPEAQRAVRPTRGVAPATPRAPPAMPQSPLLTHPLAPPSSAPPVFDPEESGDVRPEFKPATLKGRSRKPPSDGGTP